jgi:hypothetical protein
VQSHVGHAEDGGKIGNAARPLLHRLLVKHVNDALERNDVRGVIAGDADARVTSAADDFVHRVEESEDSNFHESAMWAGES